MGSSHTQELVSALAKGADRASLGPTVRRLSTSIRERTLGTDESSLEFIKTSVAILGRIDPPICAQDCYESMADAVPYLFAHGEFRSALLAADLMCSYATRLARKDLIRQSENFKAIIEKHLGNFADALIHTQHSLSLAQEIGDRKAEPLVLGNLGLLLYEIGSFEEAEVCLRRALYLIDDPGIADEKANTYHNLATVLSRMGRYEEAVNAARRSLAESFEPKTIRECYSRVVREASFIHLAIDRADLAEVKCHLEACGRYAARSSTEPAQYIYGSVEFQVG